MSTYYTIYKITNLINNMFYVGMHKTKNLEDNYMGSGKILRHAIKKYKKENFKREILYIFDNDESMKNKEKEIVNEEFVKREDTYNLKEGGEGGWNCNGKHINPTGWKHSKESIDKNRAAHLGKKMSEETCKKMSMSKLNHVVSEETRQKLREKNKGHIPWIKGKHISEETKEKIRRAHTGMKLSEEAKQKLRKPKSEESKLKNRLAHLGKTTWNKGKKYSIIKCHE